MKISWRFLSSARQTLKKDVTVYDKDRVHLSLKAGTGGEGIVRWDYLMFNVHNCNAKIKEL